eukprot:1219206-Rhodomonas_salina.1
MLATDAVCLCAVRSCALSGTDAAYGGTSGDGVRRSKTPAQVSPYESPTPRPVLLCRWYSGHVRY